MTEKLDTTLAEVAALSLRIPIADPDPELLMPAGGGILPELPGALDDINAPIAVVIEYRIFAASKEEFLHLMRERRQLRRREGARRWSLSQDVSNAELRVERYVSANWTDSVRYRNRRTVEEARNSERMLALHGDVERPQIQFLIERNASQIDARWIAQSFD